jgi:succinate dehydrogenase / fumarate reductase, cytochrome b subunit
MTWKQFFTSSVGKKFTMGLTGIFLITFLMVHVGINATALLNDQGETFNKAAHFMATNIFIRIMEFGLFGGILLHIVQGLLLWKQNTDARPVQYASYAGNKNSKWYSRSMGLLGTLLLMFLIIHVSDFWVKSRFIGLDEKAAGAEMVGDLYVKMEITFKQWWVVLLYTLAMVSLAYHLLHGFQSAFQTVGVNHSRYTPIIKTAGFVFSIVVPLLFAVIPVVIHMRVNGFL